MAWLVVTRCAVALAVVVATGCASTGRKAIPGRTDYGIYRFRENVINTRPTVVLEGEVHLTPDTISLVLLSGPCVYDQRSRDQRSIRYVCGMASFSFDRLEPIRRNSYTVRTSQLVETQYCVRSVASAAGAPVCVEYGKRTNNVDVSRSGSIRVVTP